LTNVADTVAAPEMVRQEIIVPLKNYLL